MGTSESQLYVYEAPNKEKEQAEYEMYFEYDEEKEEKKNRKEWEKIKNGRKWGFIYPKTLCFYNGEQREYYDIMDNSKVMLPVCEIIKDYEDNNDVIYIFDSIKNVRKTPTSEIFSAPNRIRKANRKYLFTSNKLLSDLFLNEDDEKMVSRI